MDGITAVIRVNFYFKQILVSIVKSLDMCS